MIDKQFLCLAEASRFSVPACPFWVASRAGGGQDWPEAIAAGGLVLSIPRTAPRLAIDGPPLFANLLPRTDDRVAKSRARGESPAAQPIVAPPLRRPCAPSALLHSNLPQSGRKPSRPARPSVVLVALALEVVGVCRSFLAAL